MIGLSIALVPAALVALLATADPETPQTRNRQPYAKVAWDTARQVHTTSHCHFWRQSVLTKAYEDGLRFITVSNYYPSAPRYPLKDVVTGRYYVSQEHAVVVNGRLQAGPFDWNAIIQHPETGWVDELPEERASKLPFKLGDAVFTDIPKGILEAPNAEHHSFTDTGAHICAPGSLYASGTFDAGNDFKLAEHGYALGTSLPWRDAFEGVLDALLVPDGGGIVVNHPVWSALPQELVQEMLDFDPRVLGIEVFNHTTIRMLDPEKMSWAKNEVLWDSILATGRQCFGFFVPDHHLRTKNWRGRNVLLAREFSAEECLRAYRRGAFYGALRGNGLRFTSIDANESSVRVRTNGATKLEFITERGIVLTADAAEAEYLLSRNAQDKLDVTFVRVKAYDGTGEILCSQPTLYRTVEQVAGLSAAAPGE